MKKCQKIPAANVAFAFCSSKVSLNYSTQIKKTGALEDVWAFSTQLFLVHICEPLKQAADHY